MHDSYKKWLEDGQPKIFCKCGCNEEMIIKNHHSWYGIPKYVCGHQNFGKHHTEKTKQKIRDNMPNRFGENNPFFKKHHTNETKQKLRNINFGENNPNFGKIFTEEHKQKNKRKSPRFFWRK